MQILSVRPCPSKISSTWLTCWTFWRSRPNTLRRKYSSPLRSSKLTGPTKNIFSICSIGWVIQQTTLTSFWTLKKPSFRNESKSTARPFASYSLGWATGKDCWSSAWSMTMRGWSVWKPCSSSTGCLTSSRIAMLRFTSELLWAALRNRSESCLHY